MHTERFAMHLKIPVGNAGMRPSRSVPAHLPPTLRMLPVYNRSATALQLFCGYGAMHARRRAREDPYACTDQTDAPQ